MVRIPRQLKISQAVFGVPDVRRIHSQARAGIISIRLWADHLRAPHEGEPGHLRDGRQVAKTDVARGNRFDL